MQCGRYHGFYRGQLRIRSTEPLQEVGFAGNSRQDALTDRLSSAYVDQVDLWEAPIWPSARRHGIPDEAIRHALRNHFGYAPDGEDEMVDLFLGPDQAGNLIEVGILSIDEERVIIHAMSARLSRFFPERR